ncbi:hypothetical protein ACQUSR_11105 [Streptomyces sp. P1-3]|uniref:hypothetical protein n=1 Tax=Streptomyces sp. P1-3 TaxID=3421658 RepID=UPI003D36A641
MIELIMSSSWRNGQRWRRGIVAALLAASIGSTAMGCSDVNDLGYEPVELGVDEARSKTKEVSSRILEMIDIKGKVTEPGPGVSRCEEGSGGAELYKTRHPWSVYGISDESVERGMGNLRKRLPGKGWKIVKDGKANSKAQDPEIVAENKKEQFAVHFLGEKGTATGDPMISVDVVSACFRAPAGTDLDREH